MDRQRDSIAIIYKPAWQGCCTLASILCKFDKKFRLYTPEQFMSAKNMAKAILIFVGAGDQEYDKIISTHKGRIFFYWTHTLTKSELSHSPQDGIGVEFSQLLALKYRLPIQIEKIFVSSKGLSEMHEDFCYLPPILPEQVTETTADKKNNTIGCFVEPAAKKNIAAQLCAIHLLKKTCLMHTTPPEYIINLIKTFDLDVEYCGTSYFQRDTDANLANLSSVELNLQITPSEEASYTAVESFLCGVPCLVGPSSPLAGNNQEFDDLCVVNKIHEPVEICSKAEILISDDEARDKSIKLATQCIKDINNKNKKYLNNFIQEVTASSQKEEELSGFFRLDDSYYENIAGTTDNMFYYYKSVDSGFKKMKERSVVICGIARDCEKSLVNIMIPRVEELIPYLGDYHICIFENDSKISSGDNTAKVLTEWGNRHEEKSHIVCEELQWTRLGGTRPNRTNNLAKHRNKVLNHVYENFSHFDYMMVIDWDLKYGFSINGIAHTIDTFDKIDDWGAATAMGINGRHQYYDAFAYRQQGYYGRYGKGILRKARAHGSRKIGSEVVRIGSGFNGLGIYNMKRLCDTIDQEGPKSGNADSLKFGNLYGDGKNCEHIRLHAALDKCGYSVWLNPSLVVHY